MQATPTPRSRPTSAARTNCFINRPLYMVSGARTGCYGRVGANDPGTGFVTLVSGDVLNGVPAAGDDFIIL